MVIEKVILKVGKKRIELTQAEYEELKQHFTDKEWVPYPYPVYPQPNTHWLPYQPIITYNTKEDTFTGTPTEYYNA